MTDRASYIWDRLKAAGLTDAGAAGLMGNLFAESGLDPGKCEQLCLNRLREYGVGDYISETYTAAVDAGRILQDEFLHPLPGKQYGYGLAQWTTEGRKRQLWEATRGRDCSIANLDAQICFMTRELKNQYAAVWDVLTASDDLAACSDVVLAKYEQPANWEQHKNARRGYSTLFLSKYGTPKEEVTVEGFDRQKVIAIAKAEEGYLEKSAAWWKQYGKEGLYSKEAGAGKDNYTKYGYEMHQLYPSVMDFPAAWCDCFVDWCFMQAYGVSNAKKLLAGNFDDYTVASAQLYKDKDAWRPAGTLPELGWQIFFKNGSKICHTGLVVDVVADTENGGVWIYTTEGNTGSAAGVVSNGGCVRRKRYHSTYSRIAGYGVPPYGDAAVAAKIAFTPHWVRDGASWYYRTAEGVNAHGWQVINGHWYFFGENGRMLTGPQSIGGHWYILATAEMSQDYEGACMLTSDAGRLSIWEVA